MFVKANRGWLLLAHIPHEGKHFDEYLGLNDTRDNRREAERIKRTLEAAILNGTFEAEFRRRFPNSKRLVQFQSSIDSTLGEFTLAWLDEHRTHLTSASERHYRTLLKNHLLGFPIASKPLSAITDGDVSLLIAALQEQFASATWKGTRTINMVIARLRTIFAAAKRRRLIADDPMQYVRNLRQPKSDVDPFDLSEALALVEAAEGWERSFVAVLIFTGMRPNEALALHWSQIDWQHGLVRVRENVSQGGKLSLPKTPDSERDVEMLAFVREALQEQRSRSQLKSELVFPSTSGTPIDLDNFRSRNWSRIMQKARVRPRTIYQCRHTCARLMIEQGDTPQHVAAQLGHANVRMVFEVYGRWLNRPTSAAMKALDQAISITHPSPKSGGKTAASEGK